jgi:hypothetical protein
MVPRTQTVSTINFGYLTRSRVLGEVSNPAIEVLAKVQTHGDLLDQPPVAVRIAERGERRVTAPRRMRAANPTFPRHSVEHFAHVDTTIDEHSACRLDVRHDEIESLYRPRPVPKWIEHGEPGGVNCTTRNSLPLALASKAAVRRASSRPLLG